MPLARALRLELDDLVPRSVPDPRVPRITKQAGEVTYVSLPPDSSPVQTYKITLPPTPAGTFSAPEPKVHDGYEWLYVLDGRLRLVLDEHDVVLGRGEAAEFDTRTPHSLMASGSGPVELLTIFSKEGKRIHLRARPVAAE